MAGSSPRRRPMTTLGTGMIVPEPKKKTKLLAPYAKLGDTRFLQDLKTSVTEILDQMSVRV